MLREVKRKLTLELAVLALIINIFVPGLGSLIANKSDQGIWQFLIFGGSVFAGMTLILSDTRIIGYMFMIIGPLSAWIWALTTSIQLIQEALKK